MTAAPLSPAPADPFVNLHVHGEYSLLDGFQNLKRMVAKVVADGGSALALTDHGSLGGCWKFAHECRAQGIKPILGLEAYISVGGDDRFHPRIIEVSNNDDVDGGDDGSQGMKKKRYEHLTILAETAQGWRNLVRIQNEANNSFYGKPLIDFNLVSQFSEGLIILTGCLGGPVAGPLSRGDDDLAREGLEKVIDAVGADNVYVEMMYHHIPAEKSILKKLRDLADEYDLPVVVTGDCHYTHAEDAVTHQVWLADQSKRTLDDPRAFSFNGHGYHLMDSAEIRDLFPRSATWQQGCDETVQIAERIHDWVLPDVYTRLPQFPLVPNGFVDQEQFIWHLVEEGVKAKYGIWDDELRDRINHEMGVIVSMGFIDYFLIVWDMIGWARRQGILVGPGRGSGAGSAVAYVLNITDVEPLEEGLLFERFLEPGRVGMPDFDTDFEQARIPEVIEHLRDVYGRDHVAQLGTFAITRTKVALKSAAKVLGMSALGQRLSNLVPVVGGKPLPFAKLLDESSDVGSDLRAAVEADPDAQRVLAHAVAMEDMVRNVGIHACGVIVSSESLLDLVPLRKLAPNEEDPRPQSQKPWVTVWDGHDCEDLGLLKLDALSLRNLDIASATARMVADDLGEVIDLQWVMRMGGTDDESGDATWAMLTEGRTSGVFQLESAGISELAIDIAPHGAADLTALGALYRPGPMKAGSHTAYAARKHGLERKTYKGMVANRAEADVVDQVLGDTFGLMVYQEQVMQLAGLVAGFDAAERSKLRKAMGKKDQAVMDGVATLFMERAVAQQVLADGSVSIAFQPQSARNLLEMIRGCGEYLFNKSHASAYGRITYMTAWLKANYPAHFAAATLSRTTDKDKRASALNSLSKDGIELLPPDVNTGGVDTGVAGGYKIRLGLSEVDQVGSSAARIIAERERRGAFRSMKDMAARVTLDDVTGKKLSISTLVSLVESGACDSMGDRAALLAGLYAPAVSTKVSWTLPVLELASRQRNRIGLALGVHPLRFYGKELEAQHIPGDPNEMPGDVLQWPRAVTVDRLLDLATGGDMQGPATVFGVLVVWAVRPYSRGRMVNWTLEAVDGRTLSGAMFDQELRNLSPQPRVGQVVTIHGNVKARMVSYVVTEADGTEVEKETLRVEVIAGDCWEVPLEESKAAVVLPGKVDAVRVGWPEALLKAAGTLPAPKPVLEQQLF